ncbi:hypothetical protein PX669_19430 (plasmid) [Acinetobacter soli]|nr:hypothetical protein PX669_19430 [Acinetobacter soli]
MNTNEKTLSSTHTTKQSLTLLILGIFYFLAALIVPKIIDNAFISTITTIPILCISLGLILQGSYELLKKCTIASSGSSR